MQYLIRLDDASDYMDLKKWRWMQELLDSYNIKPIFGIIPKNKNEMMINTYTQMQNFWEWVKERCVAGWIPAMHGYNHQYVTEEGGIHPVNKKSEFAGLSYKEQCRKIEAGYTELINHGIKPDIFFAPAHTFDEKTLLAIRDMTEIRIICDTIAYNVYRRRDFWFIPQVCGKVRNLPFPLVVFCYHPNIMDKSDFDKLEKFIIAYRHRFITYSEKMLCMREKNVIDSILERIYFSLHS